MAFIFAWSGLEALLSLAVILVYQTGQTQNVSGVVSLSLLVIFMLISVLVENSIHEKFATYIFAHWLVVIWLLIGCLTENWDTSSATCIAVIVILCFSVVYFLSKSYLAMQRYRRIKIPHRSATVAQKYPSKNTMRGNEKSVKLRQQLQF